MTTTQIKVTKKKANANTPQANGKTTRAPGARVVEVSVKRVKGDPAAAKARTAVVKTPTHRGRSS